MVEVEKVFVCFVTLTVSIVHGQYPDFDEQFEYPFNLGGGNPFYPEGWPFVQPPYFPPETTTTPEPVTETTTTLEPVLETTTTLEPVLETTTTLEPITETTTTPEPVLETTTTLEPVLETTTPWDPFPINNFPPNFGDGFNLGDLNLGGTNLPPYHPPFPPDLNSDLAILIRLLSGGHFQYPSQLLQFLPYFQTDEGLNDNTLLLYFLSNFSGSLMETTTPTPPPETPESTNNTNSFPCESPLVCIPDDAATDDYNCVCPPGQYCSNNLALPPGTAHLGGIYPLQGNPFGPLFNGPLAPSQCSLRGGECVDWRHRVCLGGVERGLCPGDYNQRCCMPCDPVCFANEALWSGIGDKACQNAGGSCQFISNYCSVPYARGMCGGPANRQCCRGAQAAMNGGNNAKKGCTLVVYKNKQIIGLNNLKVRVEPGFKPHMDKMTKWANQCCVTVHVTHAFRKQKQKLGNAIVTPATKSNHLIGHAIDFNLNTPTGWCNSKCLQGKRNPAAVCFINKVKKGGLRWGGDFKKRDPVHVDDGMNRNNLKKWKLLFAKLQKACK